VESAAMGQGLTITMLVRICTANIAACFG
jgi:hypothetical protein